ncbi:hypothetical protein AHiyo8_pI66960 (plasmid) [Arthrobacter sp. Hiyo8]|nr:hypothetical protein AHiyo8_pI66960 [Arthrobacter sp. Hiyo8]
MRTGKRTLRVRLVVLGFFSLTVVFGMIVLGSMVLPVFRTPSRPLRTPPLRRRRRSPIRSNRGH